jgi:hypothetical protein
MGPDRGAITLEKSKRGVQLSGPVVNLNRYAECMGQAALAQAQQRGAARKLCETDRNDERQKLGNATRALQLTLQARAQQAHQKIVDQCVSSQDAAVRKAALIPTLNRYTLEYARARVASASASASAAARVVWQVLR